MKDYFKGRIILQPNEIPKDWVNILPTLPSPMTPLIDPMDGKPAPPEMAPPGRLWICRSCGDQGEGGFNSSSGVGGGPTGGSCGGAADRSP